MNCSKTTYNSSARVQQMLINNEQTVDFVNMNENKTLYANPYMVVNDREYTKHYYTEGQRIASKIGGGLSPSIVPYTEKVEPITHDTYEVISDRLLKRCQQSNDCVKFNGEYTNYGKTIQCVIPLAEMDEPEKEVYFYHSDHIGSSSSITDRNGYASQHLQYLPFGELFVEQRSTANYYTPYKFSGKEKDEETSYSYFGARYYMSDVSVWLSVDPMRDKYPSMSPYNYCAGNPIVLKDPDGRAIVPTNKEGNIAISNYLSNFSSKVQRKAFGLQQGTQKGGPIFYSSDIKQKSYQEFTKTLGKAGKSMTESAKEEAYSFYKGLQSETNYQVEAWKPTVTDSYTTGEVVIEKGTETSEVTNYAPREVRSSNRVFVEDFDKIDNFGALFNSNRKSENGNIFGEGFNFYKNYDRNLKSDAAGLILIDGSKNNYGNNLGKALKLTLEE